MTLLELKLFAKHHQSTRRTKKVKDREARSSTKFKDHQSLFSFIRTSFAYSRAIPSTNATPSLAFPSSSTLLVGLVPGSRQTELSFTLEKD